MSDTNVTHTALVLFMTEMGQLLAAIVPTTSELAVAAKRFHELPIGGSDGLGYFDFVESWFFTSEARKEICPMGELKGKDYASIVAIYKLGC